MLRLAAILLTALFSATPALADPSAPAPKPAEPPKSEPAKKPEPPQPPQPKPASKPTDPTLKLGDKAPTLPAETTTIKGESIAPFASDHVYVIEFWATWCPSCREAMLHLAKLARAHKDLAVIAIASSEKPPEKNAEDDRLKVVQRFAADHSEQMPYSIVFDGQRTIATDWLVAAHPSLPRYLPFALIVDSTQTITWLGDPRRSEFDAAVEKALKVIAPPPPPPPTTTDPKKPGKAAKPKPSR